MTRLRQIAMAGLAAIAIGGVASSASAMETGTFQNRLNGATIGLPLGAAPPPGLYTGLETAYLGMAGRQFGTQRRKPVRCAYAGGGCAALPALAQAVPLLWVPGWNLLGRHLFGLGGASLLRIHDVRRARLGGNCSGACPIAGGGFVYTNTFFQPIALSWKLGGGWFMSAGFAFTSPNGTPRPARRTRTTGRSSRPWRSRTSAITGWRRRTSSTTSTPSPQGVCCAANSSDYTAATRSTVTSPLSIRSASGRSARLAISKCRRPADTGAGCNPAPGVVLCGRYRTAAAGGLVGYDFGPVDLQVWVTDSFVGQDISGGRRQHQRVDAHRLQDLGI